jgi:N-formylglutamate amidohydrolase
MKNVTISMDDELYRRTRIKAAEAQKSISRYIADRLREPQDVSEVSGGRNFQLEAIERFLAGPLLYIAEGGKMPTAEQRNERRWQRDIRRHQCVSLCP